MSHRRRNSSDSSRSISEHSVQSNVPDYTKMIQIGDQQITPPAGVGSPHLQEFVTPRISVLKTKTRVIRKETGASPQLQSPMPNHKASSAPSTPNRPEAYSLTSQTQDNIVRNVSSSESCLTSQTQNFQMPNPSFPAAVNLAGEFVQQHPHVPNFIQQNPSASIPNSTGYLHNPGYVGYIRPETIGNMSYQGYATPVSSNPNIINSGLSNNLQSSHDYVPGSYNNFYVHTSLPTSQTTVYPQFTNTPVVSTATAHVPLDLLEWQVHQQQQLRRQQLDASKNIYGASFSSAPHLQTFNNLGIDSSKWEPLKRITDSFIKEKDVIIERQKLKLQQLEQKVSDSELQLKQLMRVRAEEAGDKLSMKIQEYQYDNASLKAELADVEAARQREVEELRSQLGATEYDLEKTTSALTSDLESKTADLENARLKVNNQLSTMLEWKEKYNEMKDKYNQSRKKGKSLERYLQDLPTPEEHLDTSRRLGTLEADYSTSQTAIKDLETELSEVNSQLKMKDNHISQLEEQEQDLMSRFVKMEVEIDELQEKLKHRSLSAVELEVEELRTDNKRLREDLEKAKQIMDMKHKKLKQTEIHHQNEMTDVEEKLNQEENLVVALREELQQKDDEICKIRTSMKQIVKQNQDLMENGLIMKDKCKEFERITSAEHRQLEQTLTRQLEICFNELRALVQVCVQQAEGQEPNMSVLLGVRVPPVVDSESEGSPLPSQTLKQRLVKVQELQKDIDTLRHLISNKYAEEMGANISCAQQ